MTSGRTIDYEALAQEAMRGVVRQVLTRTAKSGLPGDHHFYISFDTQLPGVSLSKRLKEKYPEEMTIVLQHRFWDLTVTDERFEVKLTFDGIPERLVIPYAAIKVFFDPSVRYGLQFEDFEAAGDGAPRNGAAGALASGGLGSGGMAAGQPGARPFGSPGQANGERSDRLGAAATRKRPARKPRLERVEPTDPPDSGDQPGKLEVEKPAGEETPPPARGAPDLKPVPTPPAGGAQIVSLSDFRKK